MKQLAVDLGTASTVAVLLESGRAPRLLEIEGAGSMPSSVYVDERGALLVGDDAERCGWLDPLHYEAHPKDFVDAGVLVLGDRPVPVVHAFSAVLARIAQLVLEETGGHPDRVLLTCPQAWGPRQRGVLVEAASSTAWRDREILTVGETEAAAAHAATAGSVRAGEVIAVLELGAGALACAVATVDGSGSGVTLLSRGGLAELSGVGIDDVLLGHLGGQVAGRDPGRWSELVTPTDAPARHAAMVLREDVRCAKEQLSTEESVRVPVPPPFARRDPGGRARSRDGHRARRPSRAGRRSRSGARGRHRRRWPRRAVAVGPARGRGCRRGGPLARGRRSRGPQPGRR